MKQVFNFSAGPAVLPKPVLEKAQAELLNYNNTGISVMEMSHRSKMYEDILQAAKSNLKKLMAIPDNYSILFLQGGASLQFHMVPLNFAQNKKIGVIDTGNWSLKAIEEAEKINGTTVEVLASSKDKNYSYIPSINSIPDDLAYLHITSNNTLEGTVFTDYPDTDVPLVLDASSNILSCDLDVSKFALIYAGAQKNIGPAGVTVVIIRNDFKSDVENLPSMLSYENMIKTDSMFNTPPTYGIYVANLVFEWILDQGGVLAITEANRDKANRLYDYIDSSDFYTCPVDGKDRSINNIPFKTGSETLDNVFIKKAEEQNLINIKGHRLIGGMRASLYNAFPSEGVDSLIHFMKTFKEETK